MALRRLRCQPYGLAGRSNEYLNSRMPAFFSSDVVLRLLGVFHVYWTNRLEPIRHATCAFTIRRQVHTDSYDSRSSNICRYHSKHRPAVLRIPAIYLPEDICRSQPSAAIKLLRPPHFLITCTVLLRSCCKTCCIECF
jgi:hypothetical protein